MTSVAPDPLTAGLQRATALCDLGRFDDAAHLLNELVASDPDNPRAWCLLAQAQIGRERRTEAYSAATRASSLAPEYEWPHRLLSIIAARRTDYARAVGHAKEAVRLAPHEWRAYVQLADALRGSGLLDDARSAAERALELAPEEPGAHMVGGFVASAGGQRREAAAAFRKALTLDPDNSAAHHALASVHVRRRGIANLNPARFAAAAGGFAAALRADPRSDRSRRALDAVLRVFLRLVAYLVFVDALIANATRHSTSSAARIVPVAIAAVPVGYAAWFVVRLPRELRRYLLRLAFTGIHVSATVLDAGAVATLIFSEVGAGAARGTYIAIAVAAAIGARLILWIYYKYGDAP